MWIVVDFLWVLVCGGGGFFMGADVWVVVDFVI